MFRVRLLRQLDLPWPDRRRAIAPSSSTARVQTHCFAIIYNNAYFLPMISTATAARFPFTFRWRLRSGLIHYRDSLNPAVGARSFWRMAGAICHENTSRARRSACRPPRGCGPVRRHGLPARPPRRLLPPPRRSPDHAELTGVVQRYCRTCHNDRMLTGNLSLEDFRRRRRGEQYGRGPAYREDDPQAAGQHDASAGRPAAPMPRR